MSRTKNIHGPCAQCGAMLTFPAENIGMVAQCPYCGKNTELQLATPQIEPAIPRRMLLWVIVAVIILAAGLGLSLFALKRAERMAAQRRDRAAPAPVQAKPANSMAGFQWFEIHVERTRDGSAYAVGRVVNSSGSVKRQFEMRVELFDSKGVRLGLATLKRDRFNAGESWSFIERLPGTNVSTIKPVEIRALP